MSKRRNSNGTATVELPFVLWFFFFLVVFPMLDMATAGIRITILYAAAHTAAISASRAHTFLSPLEDKKSAIQLAQQRTADVVSSFTGVKVSKIETSIIITNLETLTESKTNAPLTKTADVSKNTYQIEVVIEGTTAPLIAVPLPVRIDGVTHPLSVKMSDRQYCENPQGLMI